MMSRIVPGLYFAGEVLDVDGPTGGYNLTIAFATARLAVASILARSQSVRRSTDRPAAASIATGRTRE